MVRIIYFCIDTLLEKMEDYFSFIAEVTRMGSIDDVWAHRKYPCLH